MRGVDALRPGHHALLMRWREDDWRLDNLR